MILARVELECFAGPGRQKHERAAPRGLLLPMTVCAPLALKGGDTPVGPREAERPRSE